MLILLITFFKLLHQKGWEKIIIGQNYDQKLIRPACIIEDLLRNTLTKKRGKTRIGKNPLFILVLKITFLNIKEKENIKGTRILNNFFYIRLLLIIVSFSIETTSLHIWKGCYRLSAWPASNNKKNVIEHLFFL